MDENEPGGCGAGVIGPESVGDFATVGRSECLWSVGIVHRSHLSRHPAVIMLSRQATTHVLILVYVPADGSSQSRTIDRLFCAFLSNLESIVKEFDGALDVGRLLQVDTDPAAFRENVVGFGATRRDQLIPDVFGKGNVHQTVTVDVTDFAPSQTELCCAKTVGLACDPGPLMQGSFDSLFGT